MRAAAWYVGVGAVLAGWLRRYHGPGDAPVRWWEWLVVVATWPACLAWLCTIWARTLLATWRGER